MKILFIQSKKRVLAVVKKHMCDSNCIRNHSVSINSCPSKRFPPISCKVELETWRRLKMLPI